MAKSPTTKRTLRSSTRTTPYGTPLQNDNEHQSPRRSLRLREKQKQKEDSAQIAQSPSTQRPALRDMTNRRGNQNTTNAAGRVTRGTKRPRAEDDAPLERNLRRRVAKKASEEVEEQPERVQRVRSGRRETIPSSPPEPLDNEEPWPYGPRLSTLTLPGYTRPAASPPSEPESDLESSVEETPSPHQLPFGHGIPSPQRLEHRLLFPPLPAQRSEQETLPSGFMPAQPQPDVRSVPAGPRVALHDTRVTVSGELRGLNGTIQGSVIQQQDQTIGQLLIQAPGQQDFQRTSVPAQRHEVPARHAHPPRDGNVATSGVGRFFIRPEDAHRPEMPPAVGLFGPPQVNRPRPQEVRRGRDEATQNRRRGRSRSPVRGGQEDRSMNPLRDRTDAGNSSRPVIVRGEGHVWFDDGREVHFGPFNHEYTPENPVRIRVRRPAAPAPAPAPTPAPRPVAPPQPPRSKSRQAVDELLQLLRTPEYANPVTYYEAVAKVLEATSGNQKAKDDVKQFVDTSFGKTCDVCYDRVPGSQIIALECGCTFCGTCLVAGFNNMLSTQESSPPICGCRRDIPLSEEVRTLMMRTLFTVDGVYEPDAAAFEKLIDQYKRMAGKRSAAKVYHCHACRLYIEDTGSNFNTTRQVALCNNPRCGSLTCLLCKGASHSGKCPEDKGQQALDELLKLNQLRKCPFCDTPTEKIEHCNHIECGGCKREFCYYCGGPYDYRKCRDHQNLDTPQYEANEVLKQVDEHLHKAALQQGLRNESPPLADPRKCSHKHWRRSAKGTTIAREIPKKERCRNCMEEYLWFYECEDCGLGGVCSECLPEYKDVVRKQRKR